MKKYFHTWSYVALIIRDSVNAPSMKVILSAWMVNKVLSPSKFTEVKHISFKVNVINMHKVVVINMHSKNKLDEKSTNPVGRS